MNPMDYAAELVRPYEPQVPIPELIEQLNRFFHASEACCYDARHAEVLGQIAPIWREMLAVGLADMDPRPLRILDFGCGTGFEAIRLLENVDHARIGQLVCYDPSPEMLQVCRDHLARFSCPITFVSDLKELPADNGKFDAILTNSLLHHLPDPVGAARQWASLLADRAVWLSGHEPSCRFVQNPECRAILMRFEHQWRFWKYLSPHKYIEYFRRILFRETQPAKDAALAAKSRGLVRKEPPASIVAQLVDYHVAHSSREIEMGRGFDVAQLATDLAGEWKLAWSRGYGYMGNFYEGHLPASWRRRCRDLARRFPDDASFFCAIWKK